ncbi:YidC/Oxa1 family membrane protein insertase [Haloplasma contractile]|uniref:Membrane protein insertase YidC 2 n=1 Tax=Haloplasma contractile SSD-17B TaxID=1033810 RepID=F7PWT4_9MOLU|nr:YidC/Oxa1 family membrane protein insertase [Haloplasma contractile]ERJ12541.1 Membrane protein insertase YidC 2 [Haloplasma contractile SSD-17B]
MKNKLRKLSLLAITLIGLASMTGCSPYQDGDRNLPRTEFNGFWDNYLVQPISWVLHQMSENTGEFAIGIILTTIIVRTVLFPVYTKTNESSQKMQEVQPQMKKLQAKYAGKTDPESKQKMQVEMMALYKEHGVNPLAGCIMPFLQMPVFMAMYHSVVRTPTIQKFGPFIDKTDTMHFLGLNLSDSPIVTGDGFTITGIEYLILPILVAATSILMQRVSMYGMSEEAKNNPMMKNMLFIMPVMMLVFSSIQPIALALYWFVGNIYSTLQIVFVKNPFDFKIIEKLKFKK